MTDPEFVVLIRAADAGDTYLSWRWLDEKDAPFAARIAAHQASSVLEHLDTALISPLPGETSAQALQRGLTIGAFSSAEGERKLAAKLTSVFLPSELREQIVRRTSSGARVQVRVTPSPALARLPWELTVIDSSRRLIEVADVVYDPPSIITSNRRDNYTWHELRAEPAVFVIDPQVPGQRGPDSLRPTLATGADQRPLKKRLRSYRAAGMVCASYQGRIDPTLSGQSFTRKELSYQLRSGLRSRLFYFGHVSSTPAEPGTASLHLTDTTAMWGMAETLSDSAISITAATVHDSGQHRPLSALDLMLGTTMTADPTVWNYYGADRPQLGRELWPMPPRVAMIACEGGVDYRSSETFGLVMAMIDSGSELVTTTRWTLPTDHGVRGHRQELPPGVLPTVDLALEVDHSHTLDNPIRHLADWQRNQLRHWQDSGDGAVQYSPLWWASLISTEATRRAPMTG